jgi:glutaconate CoA-transferase subunit A
VGRIATLQEAIGEHVRDGASVVLEGFSHLVPFAAGHEIIRQQRRDLTLIRLSADIIFDQMIGMGCARKLVFSWAGNPGLGLLHRFRDAVENGWPHRLDIEEYTHGALAAAFVAGASRLPFGILQDFHTDLTRYTPTLTSMRCPFTGNNVTAVRAVNPDVAIIHAQRADRVGNVQLWGVVGIQKEAVFAARKVIVTVEEICERLEPVPNGIIIPSWVVTSIACTPGGARPSYVHGYYGRDNEFYREWDAIARGRDQFIAWIDENVLECVPA